MAKKRTTSEKSTTFNVKRTYTKSGTIVGETSDDGNISVRKFDTEPAVVGVHYGTTINLGNYESAKVEVSILLPCFVEEIDDAHEFAAKWVEDKIGAEVRMVRAKLSGRANPL